MISTAKQTLKESITEAYCNNKAFPECLRIADLVFLNDLPGNDFNTIFQSLSSFYERLKKEKGDKFEHCFIAASPGSFYGRLFPNNSMHIVHSSSSLHWLSQVPKELVNKQTREAYNKGNICVSNTSPPMVFKMYLEQFQKDFTNFLRCRSEEIVNGGVMVFTIIGSTKSDSPQSILEILGRALNDMAMQNIIEEESLNNFNMPLYCPSEREVRNVIEEEGSFFLHKLNVFETTWDAGFTTHQNNNNNYNNNLIERGKYVSDYMRAAMESILVKQFGETIIDELFKRLANKVIESMTKENWQYKNLVISLIKK
ncbi:hypothetical protein G4B88_021378 [Cannabis sativa]|uniref:Uncharacterized protein n=1 Tax=Cannabis sativa TaxID=3483 RepID=A0A7J6FFV0_CANSA|nr:hypothetical protein G4B88_021378 [Cannabis sativa]